MSGLGAGLRSGLSPVNARPGPRAFLHNLRKKTKLAAGTRRLPLQATLGQGCFQVRPFDQLLGEGFDVGRDLAKERASFPSRYAPVNRRRLKRKLCRQLNFRGSSARITWL